MKRHYFTILSLFFIGRFSMAQPYTEIFEGGWGQGLNESRPVFTDIDQDGLVDMVVGQSTGTLFHYEQETVGSTNFLFITSQLSGIDFGNISAPIFIDLDNDNRLDLIVGDRDGTLFYYEQNTVGSLAFSLVSDNLIGTPLEKYATPSITDLDNDGLYDLFVGTSEGDIHHYEQDASGSSNFQLLSDSLSGIDVGDYSYIGFTDIDGNGLKDMIVGEFMGNLNHYEQNGVNSADFTLISNNFADIKVGIRSSAFFEDLDGDGLLDLVVGDSDGLIHLFEQNGPGSTEFNLITNNFGGYDVGRYSSPCVIDLDGNDLLDLIVGGEKTFCHYEQDGYGSDAFTLISDNFSGIVTGENFAPAFYDLDNDNLLDMILGYGSINYGIKHYEQHTAFSDSFVMISDSLIGFNEEGSFLIPSFVDLDRDGLVELVIGEFDGNLNHYEQNAADRNAFQRISDNLGNIDIGEFSAPSFTDLDGDSLLDLILGTRFGELAHYEQTSEASSDFSLRTANYQGFDFGLISRPTFADINRDGMEDLLVGDTYGGIYYYKRIEETGILQKQELVLNNSSFKLLPNTPNPFNPITIINYRLPITNGVELNIINLRGEKVRTLVQEEKQAGNHTALWDGRDDRGMELSSGIYICTIRAGNDFQSIKMMLIR